MRRAGRLFQQIIDRDNLRLAFVKAARGKRHRPAVREFERTLEAELADMRTRLRSGDFEVGRRFSFVIHDPKPRVIHAAAFPERVMHHAVMNLCEPVFDRKQLDSSFACRRGKGRLAAVRRAGEGASRRWFLKADVRRFFDSIPHKVLFRQLERMFKDRHLLSLFSRIIRGYELMPGCGLPIGNLTSQFFANHYLTVLDREIEAMRGVPVAVRYMDDFALFSDCKGDLLAARERLTEVLEDQLGLRWKMEPYLNRCEKGLDFLGCGIFPDRVTLSTKGRKRLCQKCRTYEAMWLAGKWSDEVLQRRMVSLLSFPRHLSACGQGYLVKGWTAVEV